MFSSKLLRDLQDRKTKTVDAMTAINNLAKAEGRDLTETEAAQFDKHAADLDGLGIAIKREQTLLDAQASLGGADNAVRIPAGARITAEPRVLDDPKHGFASRADFYKAVASASLGLGKDDRLKIDAAAPSTFTGESSGADGGFAIPPDFSKELWRLSLGEDSFLPRTANTETSKNSMVFPKDESTPWGGTGVQVYWQNEAQSGTGSKLNIGADQLVLHKLLGLVPVSNEMLEDGFAIDSYLTPLLSARINWKINESIFFGNGVGQPLGCLTNAGSTGVPAVVVDKEAGQAAASLDPKNISKMVSRLMVGELSQAFWLATPDILPALEALTVGQYPVYLPNVGLEQSPYGMLKGRPLFLSEHACALGSKSDLSLVSLRGYRTLTKANGIQVDTSMHLYFDADATAFRIRFRFNGKPILSCPVTPPKSGNTRSHFVTLAARP